MLRDPFGVALLIYYLVMAVVGMVIPDDILMYARAKEFSDYMASIVPQIDHVAALNIKPGVNRFYFSVLWIGSPLWTILLVTAIIRAKNQGAASIWTDHFLKLLWPMTVVAGLSILGLQFSWIVNPELKISKLIFENDLARGLVSQLFVSGIIFGILCVAIWILGWVTGYIPRVIEGNREKNGR